MKNIHEISNCCMSPDADDTLHEECGVFGMYDFDGNDVASSIYYGLFALQHRGQESCGIVVNDDGVRYLDSDAETTLYFGTSQPDELSVSLTGKKPVEVKFPAGSLK